MAKAEKAAAIAELKHEFESSNGAVLTEYRGLTVAQLKELRTNLGETAPMKTILITGATSGIGYEAAIVLAREGHRVVMVGRDKAKTERCVAEVKQKSGASNVEFLLGDFASLASVRALAADFLAKYDRLDVLVNNAGTVYDTRTVTVDGFEATWAVNHLAPFLLTKLLLATPT